MSGKKISWKGDFDSEEPNNLHERDLLLRISTLCKKKQDVQLHLNIRLPASIFFILHLEPYIV